MLLRYLLNKHSIVSSAAVFEKNGKYFPESRYNGVLLVSVIETLFNEFIEPYRIHKQRSVYSINQLIGNSSFDQHHALNAVSGDGILVLRFQDNARDI
jgi:hypothetical protein